MNWAAASVSAGTLPSGAVAATNSLLHASAFTRVAQPASTSDSVAKLAMVGDSVLFSASAIVVPYPPVERSTKLGTLPAAMRRPSVGPLIEAPSRNRAAAYVDATVVNSLTTTCAGALPPSTARKVRAGLLPACLLAEGVPAVATR